MSIPSTPMQSIDNRTQQRVDSAGLDIGKRRAHIINVQFAAHAFDVNMDGYGFLTAPVDASIDIGTDQRPKIWRGNDCWVQKDPLTKQWHVTEIIWTKTCVANPTINAPFTPPASSSLPLDTQSLTIPSLPDLTFLPTVIAAGQVVPNTKMPPVVGGASVKLPAYRSRCYITFFDNNYEALPAGVAVAGHYLYAIVASGSGPTYYPILVIYDISDVSNPLFISRTDLTSVGQAQAIIVRGIYAYITGNLGTNEVGIWDVSDPNLPVKVGAVSAAYTTGNLTSFNIGTSRYVARSYAGATDIIDVTTPAVPSVVSTIAFGLAAWATTEPFDSTLAEGAYLHVNTGGALRVYDVTTPAAPAFLGSVAIASMIALIWARDDKTIVCGKTNGFVIVDVSNPASPSILSTVVLPGSFPGADGLYGSGDYLYVTSSNKHIIAMYDISTPATPALVGTIGPIDVSNGLIGFCLVDRTHLFTCEQLADNNFNNNPGCIGIYDLFGTG